MESFEQLAEQYQPMIHKIVHSLHLYKDKEEYFQLGLIALWEASMRFDPNKGSFPNYAYTSIKGTLLTELRKTLKDAEKYIFPKEEFWELIEDPGLERPLLAEDLNTYCQALTVNQRKWLFYTVNCGLSIKELAEQENVSLSAVKSWRAGARAKLVKQRDGF